MNTYNNRDVKISTSKGEFTIDGDYISEGKGTINDKEFSISTVKSGSGSFHIIRDDQSYRADVLKADPEEKTFLIRVNGDKFTIQVKDKFDLLLAEMGLSDLAKKKVNELKSPMPGLVLEIQVQEGDVVKKGDPLLILEAMKMENVLKSPADVTVKSIEVEKGKAVEKNELLIRFE